METRALSNLANFLANLAAVCLDDPVAHTAHGRILCRIRGPAIRKQLSTFMGVERARSHNARLNSFHVAAVSLGAARWRSFSLPISRYPREAKRRNARMYSYAVTNHPVDPVDSEERLLGNRKQIALYRLGSTFLALARNLFLTRSFKKLRGIAGRA